MIAPKEPHDKTNSFSWPSVAYRMYDYVPLSLVNKYNTVPRDVVSKY